MANTKSSKGKSTSSIPLARTASTASANSSTSTASKKRSRSRHDSPIELSDDDTSHSGEETVSATTGALKKRAKRARQAGMSQFEKAAAFRAAYGPDLTDTEILG